MIWNKTRVSAITNESVYDLRNYKLCREFMNILQVKVFVTRGKWRYSSNNSQL
jgi:hypothetical protein